MRVDVAGLVRRAREATRALPRPTPRQWAKAAPFIVFAIALLVLVGRNWDTVDFPHYDAPEGFVPAPPPTTLAPGFEHPVLAAVAGATTTTIPANVGHARLGGTVRGPQGPVPGAVVRIERAILGEVQALDVLSDAAGVWAAPGIGGGRYRVRAYLAPRLAQRTAEVFLLRDGDEHTLDLVLEEFGQPAVSMAAAPAPAFLDQQVNVAVLVSGRVVDSDGFVSVQGLPGAFVEVSHGAGWRRSTPAGSLITDGDGQVVVTYECEQVGSVQIQATVRLGPAEPPILTTANFDCIDPASLTTTTTAPGPVDGPGNTTSSSSTTSTTAP